MIYAIAHNSNSYFGRTRTERNRCEETSEKPGFPWSIVKPSSAPLEPTTRVFDKQRDLERTWQASCGALVVLRSADIGTTAP